MRCSVLYLAFAGLASIAQATPTANKPAAAPPAAAPPAAAPPAAAPPAAAPPAAAPPAAAPPAAAPPAAAPPAAPPVAAPPAGGGNVNNANRTVTLTVEKGDTLGQIARLFNSGICNIAALNKIANPDFIEVGQVLQIPVNVAAPDNDSCLNRGGAIPPAAPPANATAPGAAPPAAPAPAPGGGGKKNKRRARTVNLSPQLHNPVAN